MKSTIFLVSLQASLYISGYFGGSSILSSFSNLGFYTLSYEIVCFCQYLDMRSFGLLLVALEAGLISTVQTYPPTTWM